MLSYICTPHTRKKKQISYPGDRRKDKTLGWVTSTSSTWMLSRTNAHTPCLAVSPPSLRKILKPGMPTTALEICGVRWDSEISRMSTSSERFKESLRLCSLLHSPLALQCTNLSVYVRGLQFELSFPEPLSFLEGFVAKPPHPGQEIFVCLFVYWDLRVHRLQWSFCSHG